MAGIYADFGAETAPENRSRVHQIFSPYNTGRPGVSAGRYEPTRNFIPFSVQPGKSYDRSLSAISYRGDANKWPLATLRVR